MVVGIVCLICATYLIQKYVKPATPSYMLPTYKVATPQKSLRMTKKDLRKKAMDVTDTSGNEFEDYCLIEVKVMPRPRANTVPSKKPATPFVFFEPQKTLKNTLAGQEGFEGVDLKPLLH